MGVTHEKDIAASSNDGSQDSSSSEAATSSSHNSITEQHEADEPSKEELETLRRVGSKVPNSAWMVATFSGAERFAFYAMQSPLQNYIQNPAEDFGRPGALGMGQSAATALNSALELICYTTPVLAGVLADGRWGPYKTLVVSCW
ncbi:uncharacterized protein KY384_008844 [Bacidia gigantensis]|uniref:uncharacterized protein n=1 Tax=Bacidia gigantensis TaxID=2732470 RepID=UPI001D049E74|nr:uncharacterized protein KY384_008844 [Bacidia gigantensis]KAG8525200.1 hypothetical protein KY384_008844 [Bacidia gigantensis]